MARGGAVVAPGGAGLDFGVVGDGVLHEVGGGAVHHLAAVAVAPAAALPVAAACPATAGCSTC